MLMLDSKRLTSYVILSLLLFTVFTPLAYSASGSYSVDSSVSVDALSTYGNNRYSFSTDTHEYIFYFDSDDLLYYKWRVFGGSFSARVVVGNESTGWPDYNSLDIFYNNETSHIHLAVMGYNQANVTQYGVNYRQGVINGTTHLINWLEDFQFISETYEPEYTEDMNIASTPDDYPYLAMNGWWDGGWTSYTLHIKVVSSSFNNGTWVTDMNTIISSELASKFYNDYNAPIIIPNNNDQFLVLWVEEHYNWSEPHPPPMIQYNFYNGTDWEGYENTTYVVDEFYYSASFNEEAAIIAYSPNNQDLSYDCNIFKFYWANASTGFHYTLLNNTGVNNIPSVCAETNSNSFTVYILRSGEDEVDRLYYNTTDWLIDTAILAGISNQEYSTSDERASEQEHWYWTYYSSYYRLYGFYYDLEEGEPPPGETSDYLINLRRYENGTLISTPYTASIILEDYTLLSQYVDADNTELNTTSPIYVFTYPLLENATSRSLFSPSSPITPLVPVGPTDVYLFNIRDTTGILNSRNGVLQAYVDVNGTYMVVDTHEVTKSINGVPLTLERSRLVNLRFLLPSTNETYIFGYFTPLGSNVDNILELSWITFDRTINLVSSWVLVNAVRSGDYETVTCGYENLLTAYDVDVDLEVRMRNGTVVYTGSSTSQSHTFTVPGLDPDTDYITMWTMAHGYFGEHTLYRNWAFEGNVTYGELADLEDLGWTFGGITYVIPTFLLLFVAGVFSYLSGPLGLIFTVLTAGIMWKFEWLPLTAEILALAFSLAIIFALGRRDRG